MLFQIKTYDTKLLTLIIITLMSISNLFGQGKSDKDKFEFKFQVEETMAVFTCSHVLDDNQPILHVSHDREDDWQFLCGQENHSEDTAKIISLREAVVLDSSLNDLFEMPIGVGAERKSVDEPWNPFRIKLE